MDIERVFTEIGVTETLNAILVQENARPAFMLQPPDYSEKTSNDPKIKKKIHAISTYFPTLHVLDTYAGTIFSKKKLDPATLKTDGDIGKALGYLCTDTYEEVRNASATKQHVGYDLIVNLKDHHAAQIFGTMCPDTSQKKEFQRVKEKIEKALRENEYIGPLLNSVELVENIITSPSVILEKLYSNKVITDDDNYVIKNAIFNSGFSFELQQYEFDYTDPFIRGIVATILSYYIYDPLEPFFPLQKYPKEGDMSMEQTKKLESSILTMLTKHRSLAHKYHKQTRKNKNKSGNSFFNSILRKIRP